MVLGNLTRIWQFLWIAYFRVPERSVSLALLFRRIDSVIGGPERGASLFSYVVREMSASGDA